MILRSFGGGALTANVRFIEAVHTILTNPRGVMWFCRAVPVISWVIVAVLFATFDPQKEYGPYTFEPEYFLLSLALFPYLLLLYGLLPQLIYQGEYRGFKRRAGYFAFAGLTAGLGPIIYYFLRVDPTLRKLPRQKRNQTEPPRPVEPSSAGAPEGR